MRIGKINNKKIKIIKISEKKYFNKMYKMKHYAEHMKF